MNERLTIGDAAVCRRVLGVLVVLCCGMVVSAQPGPPGQTETDRVVQAHQAIDSAVVEARFGQYFSYPDETEFVTAEYRVVLDRVGKRVRVARPGYTLVCDGRDVLLVADALPGRHLRVPLDGALTYERLVEVFPDLAQPLPPALVMLLSESPMDQISGSQSASATRYVPEHDAPAEGIYLRAAVPQGTGELAFDQGSRLLQSLLVQIDPQVLAGSGLDAVRLHYQLDWSSINKPIDDAEFELDLKQSQEMTTLAAFLSPSGGGGQAAAGQQGGQGAAAGGNTLIGLPLPDMALDVLGSDAKIKLSELDEGVVVLEFFATWSKASVLDLPALADFKVWCKEQKHEVPIYGIAVGEQAEKMTQWMAALEKTADREVDLPILLDPTTNAAMAMKLPTVPRTLVVIDGRVVEVYGGVKPTFLDDLKNGLPGWLDQVKAKEDDAEKE